MKRSYHVEFDLDLKRNPHKGLYVAFEGIDGAGKTVQAERLLEYFQNNKKDCLIVNEPRRTGLIGRVINEVLQQRVKIPDVSLQYLIAADRISEMHDLVLPSLEKKTTVISHRCFWSAVPYGILDITDGKGNFEAADTIIVSRSILSLYYQIIVPDITFYLDIAPEKALNRLKKMGGSLEYYEKLDKLKKINEGYHWLIKKFPKEFVVIDGDQDPDQITKDLIEKIENYKK